MKECKKELLLVMLALFAVLIFPMNTKAMSVELTDTVAAPSSKASIITASTNAVTITKGKSKTVTICYKPKKISMLTAKASNSNISMKWTGWNITNNKLVITGLKAGTTTIKLTNTYNSDTCTIKVTVKAPNPVTYRAAIIGQYDYKLNNDLPACKNDAAAMARACQKSGYSVVKTKYNASGNDMKNLISTAFAGADSNDVSLFFYSGHGASSGALCSIESYYDALVDISYLASWLKQVPGTVIVLFDSCYSGMSINKSANGEITTSFAKSVSHKDAANFNTSVVNEFAKADAQVKAASKSGELCSSKFRVITACSKDEYSWCSGGSTPYSYFTYYVVKGAGVSYTSGSVSSSAPADTDKNNIVTVNECWKYARKNAYNHCINVGCPDTQSAQVYPSNSTTRIFKR